MIGDLAADKSYEFVLVRQGKEMKLNIKLEKRKAENEITKGNRNLWPGFSPFPLTDDVRKELKIADTVKGIVIGDVETGTSAQVAGLRQYDVITKVNQKTVNNLMDFYAALNESKENEIMLKFTREGVESIVGLVR